MLQGPHLGPRTNAPVTPLPPTPFPYLLTALDGWKVSENDMLHT